MYFTAVVILTLLICVVTVNSQVPSVPPQNVSGHNMSSTSLRISWRPIPDQYRHGILLGYTVYWRNTSNTTGLWNNTTVTANVLSLDILALGKFTNYSIKISGSTINGSSNATREIVVTTDEDVPSVPPQNVAGHNMSSTSLRIIWSPIPVQYRHGILVGYIVYWRNTSHTTGLWNVTTVTSGVLSLDILELGMFTNYSIKLSGSTIKGSSIATREFVFTTDEDAPKEPPSALYINATSSDSIVVQWQPPRQELVPGIIRGYTCKYQAFYTGADFLSKLKIASPTKVGNRGRRAIVSVQLEFEELNVTVNATTHSVQLQGLQGDTTYKITVYAFTNKNGVASDPKYITTPESVPTMSPINVSAEAHTHTSLMVRWHHPPPAHAHGIIKGYLVFYQLGNQSEVTIFNESQIAVNRYLEVTHLNIFAWYSLQVAAYTSIGLGVKSEVVYARTKEWFPYKAPDNLKASNFKSPKTISVSWTALPLKYWNGFRVGYKLYFTQTHISGQELYQEERTVTIRNVTFDKTYFLFTEAEVFTKYKIEVLAFTVIGDGVKSKLTTGSTCNTDRDEFETSWTDLFPYSVKQNGTIIPSGIIPILLKHALRYSYGFCDELNNTEMINFRQNGIGNSSFRSDMKELKRSMNESTSFTFPIIKPIFQDESFKYIEFVEVPGLVVIGRRSDVEKVGENVQTAVNKVMGVMIIFFVLCWLAGVIIWILDRVANTNGFRQGIIPGSVECFYWAFVTCTTLGYGDKVPGAKIGQIFTIIWILAGLVLISILGGVLTSTLTREVVVPYSNKIPKTKMGVVHGSWEHFTALQFGINIGANYTIYGELFDAISKREIRNGIVDPYIPEANKLKLKKMNIQVKQVLPIKGSVGLMAAGEARKLAPQFRSYLKDNPELFTNVLEESLQQLTDIIANQENEESPDRKMGIEPVKVEFFHWKSEVFQFYLRLFGSLFAAAFLIGCFYEKFRIYRKKKAGYMTSVGRDKSHISHNNETNPVYQNEHTSEASNVRPPISSNLQRPNHSHLLPQRYTTSNYQPNSKCIADGLLLNEKSRQDVRYRCDSLTNENTGDCAETSNDKMERSSDDIISTMEINYRECDSVVEAFYSKLLETVDELEKAHIQERLELDKNLADKFGKFQFVETDKFKVPF